MKKKQIIRIAGLSLLSLIGIFLLVLVIKSRTNKPSLALKVVNIYEGNKNNTQLGDIQAKEIAKRYLSWDLTLIPALENYSLYHVNPLKSKPESLLLHYKNNSYQAPLLVVVYKKEALSQFSVNTYKKFSHSFITYNDYEMPLIEQNNFVFVFVSAFNDSLNLNGAIDMNRERDWKFLLPTLTWVKS